MPNKKQAIKKLLPLKNVSVTKDKEEPRSYSRLEEMKETR